MNKILLALVILINSHSFYAQDYKMNVESFFNQIFNENELVTKEFYKEHIFSECKRISKKKLKILHANIDHLKSINSTLLNKNTTTFSVQKYEDCKLNDLAVFNKSIMNNVLVISENKKVVTYVLIQDSKIKSFNTITKSGETFFFGEFN